MKAANSNLNVIHWELDKSCFNPRSTPQIDLKANKGKDVQSNEILLRLRWISKMYSNKSICLNYIAEDIFIIKDANKINAIELSKRIHESFERFDNEFQERTKGYEKNEWVFSLPNSYIDNILHMLRS